MPSFKLKDIKQSARKLQESWLISALDKMYGKKPEDYPDEALHIAQMYAHAMEIKDKAHAFEIVKRSLLEWEVLHDMMEEEKEKAYEKSTTTGKTKTATKDDSTTNRTVRSRKRSTRNTPTTPSSRGRDGRKK